MTRFLYIVLLIAAAFFYPLYADDLSFLLLVALIILPLILLVQLFISSAFMVCKAERNAVTVFRGEEGEISLRIINDSVFPLPNTKIRIKAVFSPYGAVEYRDVSIPVPALSSETVTVNLGTEHCGKADITVEYVKIYDLLQLFSIKRYKKKIRSSFCIIPKVNEEFFGEAQKLIGSRTKEPRENDITKSISTEPGDVCGFREFMPGDRLTLMHYKLSARFDKDIVKVLGSGGGVQFLLTADLSADDFDRRDRAFERFMSIAYFMNKAGSRVFAAVPEGTECTDISADGCCAALFGENDYSKIGAVLCGTTGVKYDSEYAGDLICVDLSE